MAKKKDLLTEFDGHAITRDGDSIEFGCGAVQVSRKDLLLAAEALKSKVFRKHIKPLESGNFDNDGEVRFNDVDDFLSAAQVLSNPKYAKAIRSILNLVAAANGEKDFDQIISITPATLLEIAG